MKLTQDAVFFINVCFRIFLMANILKLDQLKKSPDARPIRHWLDPISKRVFLILANGLNEDFLRANSTPFMQDMLDRYGSFAVSLTGYLETNREGLRSIITGVPEYSFQVLWTEGTEYESLLEYVNCKCIIGRPLPNVHIPCDFLYDHPLENFSELPHLFDTKNRKPCLYVINFDFDPVLVGNYGSRLKKLDDDIKLMTRAVDSFWNNSETTYIVTSARGSPVGQSLSINAPLLAWGKGIANTSEVISVRPIDLTSMICILLGTTYPTGMRGIFPVYIMEMTEYHLFELASYTIRHFETVLRITDLGDYLMESSELQLEQLVKRLHHVVSALARVKFLKWFSFSVWAVLTTTIWGLNFLVLSTSGTACVSLSRRSILSLVVMVLVTVPYVSHSLGRIIALEVLLWFTFQNVSTIDLGKNFYQWLVTVSASIIITVFAGIFGSNVTLPLFFVPVIFWCFSTRSYRKSNLFVLLTRIASGIALCFLPLSRTFGVMPDLFCLSLICFLFLFLFFLIFISSNEKIDLHIKINILMAIVTRLYVNHLYQSKSASSEGLFPLFVLAFAGFSVIQASGSILVRLLKIFLALFIPVQMFSIQLESIFYLCIVYHMFTWVFVEYHSWTRFEGMPHLNVFSVHPGELSRSSESTEDNNRHLIFLFVYCHLSYFAMGHYPDLHSYDLYVLPTFMYPFANSASYTLGVIKFIIPFFVVTSSLIAVRSVQGKNFDSLIAVFLWLTDAVGCWLVFCSEVVNTVSNNALPVRFSYFIIQQFANISIILSYSMSKYLLLEPKRFPWNISTQIKTFGAGGKVDVAND